MNVEQLHGVGSCLKTWPHDNGCTDLRPGTVRVADLRPGDVIEMSPMCSATFITAAAHPLYLGFRLVVWRLDDGHFSFDALAIGQEVGKRREMGFQERVNGLQEAMRHE